MVLRVGQQVGSYRIVAQVSHGAYATVYQASHMILTSRVVALKLLHAAQLHSEEDSETFFREARILETLRHPYILPLIDVNVHGKFPYIVTEFASNGSLRTHLLHPPLSIDETIAILTQVSAALQFAHQHNIVHSDVKPENILFNSRDEAVMADFDIAQTLSRSTAQISGLGGTPAYMAPEQFLGKVRKESDQYSFACIAYEMLTGQRPFNGDSPTALKHAHLYQQPLPPTQVNPTLSRESELIILKAMARKPTDRYNDIATFSEALCATLRVNPAHRLSPLVLKENAIHTKEDDEIYYEKTELNLAEDDGPEKTTPTRKRRTVKPAASAKPIVIGPAHVAAEPATRKKVAEEEKPVRTRARKTPLEAASVESPPSVVKTTRKKRTVATSAEEHPAPSTHLKAVAKKATEEKPMKQAKKSDTPAKKTATSKAPATRKTKTQ